MYGLAHRLGIDVEIVAGWSTRKISEYMAYDLTQDKDWVKRAEIEMEKQRQAQLSPDEQAELFKRILKGGN